MEAINTISIVFSEINSDVKLDLAATHDVINKVILLFNFNIVNLNVFDSFQSGARHNGIWLI